jgi:hypothetical protein
MKGVNGLGSGHDVQQESSLAGLLVSELVLLCPVCHDELIRF